MKKIFNFQFSIFKQPRGQVMLAVVIFFLAFSLALILGFALPILQSTQNAGDLAFSEQAYFAAESLGGDIVYRLIAGKATAATESMPVCASSLSSAIASPATPPIAIGAFADFAMPKFIIAPCLIFFMGLLSCCISAAEAIVP